MTKVAPELSQHLLHNFEPLLEDLKNFGDRLTNFSKHEPQAGKEFSYRQKKLTTKNGWEVFSRAAINESTQDVSLTFVLQQGTTMIEIAFLNIRTKTPYIAVRKMTAINPNGVSYSINEKYQTIDDQQYLGTRYILEDALPILEQAYEEERLTAANDIQAVTRETQAAIQQRA